MEEYQRQREEQLRQEEEFHAKKIMLLKQKAEMFKKSNKVIGEISTLNVFKQGPQVSEESFNAEIGTRRHIDAGQIKF